MTIFGKVLVVLNILAALVFIYFAAADWGMRQTWSYAVLQYDFKLTGLPVDDEDRDPVAGFNLVEQFPDIELQISGSAGWPDIKTQQAVVERVRDDLHKEIDSKDGEAAKRQKLAAILIPLQETGGQRDAMADRIATERLDDLLATDGPFEQIFTTIFKEKDKQVKRQAIAHLLFNVGGKDNDLAWQATTLPSGQKRMMYNPKAPQADMAPWHQRVVTVVGVKAYVDEANRQAQALRDMILPVQLAMQHDRAAFVARHNEVVETLRVLTDTLRERERELATHKKLRAQHGEQVQTRTLEFNRLQAQLDAAKNATREALAKQKDEETWLFNAQRGVDETQRQNEQLEHQIRSLEKVDR